MIILVTGWFDVYDRHSIRTGKKEFVVSHGIDVDNDDRHVILPCVPPEQIEGSSFDRDLNEWVIL